MKPGYRLLFFFKTQRRSKERWEVGGGEELFKPALMPRSLQIYTLGVCMKDEPYSYRPTEAGDLRNWGGWETNGTGMDHTETATGVSKIISKRQNYFNLKHLMKAFIVTYYGEWKWEDYLYSVGKRSQQWLSEGMKVWVCSEAWTVQDRIWLKDKKQ